MSRENHKVTERHLARNAYLYIRQSTLRQVVENTESTRRQYELRDRAHALGWPIEKVMVIDSDLGQSGADRDRAGFKNLVGEVSVGHAGIVLGLEVSRLARNSSDWRRLLEFCALTDTLILDEDGVYDPCDFNDRLILGLKGQMSEAELHMLRARLQGGIANRAKRGELKVRLPVGLVYDPLDRVVLDPDAQVRNSVTLLFETFMRTGSAMATVKAFRATGLKFPRRPWSGPHKGTLHWDELLHSRVLQVLHNPRYAGAFVFGRQRRRRLPDGTFAYRRGSHEEATVLLRDCHPGYITWERFEAHQQRLAENRTSGADSRRPPREGPALLQGLALCGLCGSKMAVSYHLRRNCQVPDYICQRQTLDHSLKACQRVPGRRIDQAIAELLVDLMTPTTLEVALRVQQDLEAQLEQIDVWRRQQVQRAREEVDLARLRFMNTHPDNRMVVDALEAEWDAKLRYLDTVRHDCDRRRDEQRRQLETGERERILELACDFPKLWRDPATPDRERKRMIRLLVEDITITGGEEIGLDIRLRGGATRRIAVTPDPPRWKTMVTPPGVIDRIDALLDAHSDGAIADLLNQQGYRSGTGQLFNKKLIQALCWRRGLKTRYKRLRERGLLTREEMAQRLDIQPLTVVLWRRQGLLVGHPWNDRNQCLYEMPDPPPVRNTHKLARMQRAASDHAHQSAQDPARQEER